MPSNQKSSKTTPICLWSSPRNISTALMYAFAQRNDMTVIDEPLYAHYLQLSGIDHPGRDQIITSQNTNGEQVINEVILKNYTTPFSLHKQMTHHLDGLNKSFLKQTKNVLLIRSPFEIVLSYSKVRKQVTPLDIGIPQQHALFNHLNKTNSLTAVIDAKILLLNPAKILKQLCQALDIPFQQDMLFWKAGPRKEDGVWAKHWYANVHKSTGFQKYQPKTQSLSDELQRVADQCQPFYDTLLQHALK